ncbi:MAG: Nramp family divalent metal transporter [Candidatus Aminicenantales bacterium]
MAGKNKKSFYGPGFLVTAAFIGPGTVTSCSLAGAHFGYALLFVLVFAILATLILQEMTGRLALGSQRDLAQCLREFPQRKAARLFYIILTLSSISFGCVAYEAGNIIGGSLGLEISTSVPRKYWVALITLTAIFILNKRTYRFVERFLIFLVFVMSVSFVVTAIIVKPDFVSILKGIVPSFPRNSLYLILALVGTTVVPYNLFLHSSAVREKWSSLAELKYLKRDLLVSITLGGIISMAIVVASAAAFNQSGIPLENGIQLAQQLRPLFGSLTNFLFGIGLFAAGMSSALTAPYAAAYASSGVLGWTGGTGSTPFRLIWLSVIMIGFIVSCFQLNPLAIIIFAQVANGLVLPVATVFLLIVLNNRKKLGSVTNTLRQNIRGIIVALLVIGLGLWNIIKVFLK